MGETWTYSSVGPDKSQKWIRGDRWSKDEGHTFSVCITDGHLSFERMPKLEDKAPKIQRSSCTPRRPSRKMISGSYAVLREQGSSASQMTAAKVMDIISRLPGCAGQAADAVSAYTQVQMEDAPKLLKKSKIPNRNVQTFGFVYHDTNGLNHGPVWKTQSFLLSETCTVIF